MADIVIQGMEMPKERSLWLCIKTDGTVYNIKPGVITTAHALGTVILLPEGHGRLIEKKSARAKFCQFCFWKHQNKDACERCAGCPIDFIPTIVPAEGGNADG